MSPKEKQATPKVAFVFLGPLTKVPPAAAGSGARLRGEPESAKTDKKESLFCECRRSKERVCGHPRKRPL